jgi:hypothetical protein
MIDWPVAYVRDMQDRYKVLGPASLTEFEALQRRLEDVQEDEMSEED